MARNFKGVAGLFDDAFDAGVRIAPPAPSQSAQGNILPINPFGSSRNVGGWLNLDPPIDRTAPRKNTVNVADVSPGREYRGYKERPNSVTQRIVSNSGSKMSPEEIEAKRLSMLEMAAGPQIKGNPGKRSVRRNEQMGGSPVIEPNHTARHPFLNRLGQNVNQKEHIYDTGADIFPRKETQLVPVPGTHSINERMVHVKPKPSENPLVHVPGHRVETEYISGRQKRGLTEKGSVASPSHVPAMGFGSANAVVGGALVGGGTAWIGSTEENRGAWTFAKGATFGAAGGAVVSGVASRGMISGVAEWGQAVSKNFDFGTEFAGKAVQAARGIESAEARAALFATGAMLGGGMFGTNRNRAQGLNSTRGNRFGG
jgi:hypothetical protein